MSDADVLGENIIVDTDDSAAPPPPPSDSSPLYAMAHGEKFTREQYHRAGWTDDQLLAAGKMSVISVGGKIELTKPLGMPDGRWVVLDDNDDIPPTGLFVGHNGTGYLIQTGVPVFVPVPVLGVIDDAVMDAPVLDPRTKQVMGYRPRPRYTYREVDAPADAA